MKHFVRLIFADLLLILLMAGCDQLFFEPDIQKLSFPKPKAIIDLGPEDGEVINFNHVNFSWHGNDSLKSTYFEYKLEGLKNEWVSVGTQRDITFEHLDEGDYTFRLKEFESNGNPQDTADTRSFSVDAIKGPALVLKRQYIRTSLNSTFTIDMLSEDISSLLGVKAILEFDPKLLEITKIESLGNFSCISSELETANLSGYVEINSILLDNQDPVFSNSLQVGKLTFRTLNTATDGYGTSISFKNTSELRDINNISIVLLPTDLYNSIIEITDN